MREKAAGTGNMTKCSGGCGVVQSSDVRGHSTRTCCCLMAVRPADKVLACISAGGIPH